MKRILLIILTILSLNASSQLNEVGAFGGVSYYVGDLNPYKHFNNPHLAGGLLYRRNLNERFALRFSATYGNVDGADSLSTNTNLQSRNLSFRSRIIEVGPIIEMNFIRYAPGSIEDKTATMYLFAGLTFFHMNPQGLLNDEYYDLQTLGTEGQGTSLNSKKEYSLNQLSIPLGIGIKGNLSKYLCISFEYGIRKTFTDYLDDVSGAYVDPTVLRQENGALAAYFADQTGSSDPRTNTGTLRGNPNNKDWYAFTGVMITVAIGKRGTCHNQFK